MQQIVLEIRQKEQAQTTQAFSQWRNVIASSSVLTGHEAFVLRSDAASLTLVFQGPLAAVNAVGYVLWLREQIRSRPDMLGDALKLSRAPFQVLMDYAAAELRPPATDGIDAASSADPLRYGERWRKHLQSYFLAISDELYRRLQSAFTSQFTAEAVQITDKGTGQRHGVRIIPAHGFFGLPEPPGAPSGFAASPKEDDAVRIGPPVSAPPRPAAPPPEPEEEPEPEIEQQPPARKSSRAGLIVAGVVVAAAAAIVAFIALRPEPPAAPAASTTAKDLKDLIPTAANAPAPVQEAPDADLIPLAPIRAEMANPEKVFDDKWKAKRPKTTAAEVKSAGVKETETVKKEPPAEEPPPPAIVAVAPTPEPPAEAAPPTPAEPDAKTPAVPQEITAAQYWTKKQAIKSGAIDAQAVKAEVDPQAETGSIFLAKLKVVADNMIIDQKMKKIGEIPSDDPAYAVERRNLEEQEISGVLTFQIEKRPDVLKSFGQRCEVEEVAQFLFNLSYLEYTKKKYYALDTFKAVANAIDPTAARATTGKPVLDVTGFVQRCYQQNKSPENARRLTGILVVSLYYLEHIYYSYVKEKPPERLNMVEKKVYAEIEKMVITHNVAPEARYFDELVLSVVSYHQRYRELPLNEGPLLDKIRVRCWQKPEVSRYCKF